MNTPRVTSFIDAVLSDRRPGRFKAGPIEANILRVAIAMRAARPGGGVPEERFVARLHQELALQVDGTDTAPARMVVTRRARLMMGAAAAVTMLGGTVAATTTVDHALAAASASHATRGELLRMGTFESTGGRVVGQIVAYRGDPSWVFMSIRAPGMNGSLRCQIEMDNGQKAATGSFEIHNGVGEWARPISADVSRIRGATLASPTGSALATATFRAI
jgi:hypothetical protein